MPEHEHLLREYVQGGSESAFRELVTRYIDLVYSVAFRQVGADAQLAQDVVQTVFTDLARQAPKLTSGVRLGGWLHRDTCFVAAKLVRTERRRQVRERHALEMNTLHSLPDSTWEQLAPVLDEAIDQLSAADREAIVLRFFERQDFRKVGAALGLSEDASQKRVSRALEKLRRFLVRRGVTLSAGALGSTLAGQALISAPAGMAASVAGTALAGATASAGGTLSLLKLMTMTQLKAGAISALFVAAVATPLAVQYQSLKAVRLENAALLEANQELPQLREENQRFAKLKVDAEELQRLRQEHLELVRLRGEVGRLQKELHGRYALMTNALNIPQAAVNPAEVEAASVDAEALAKALAQETVNAMKQLGLAARLYATDNGDQLPTSFDQMKGYLPNNFPAGIGLDLFEFVQHVRPVSETEPEMLLFREHAARRRPDGKWIKVYCLVDGSVWEQISENGTFEPWESQHLATPLTP